MKTAKLIIIGFGTIGRGVSEVLNKKYEFLKNNYGIDLQVVAVCEVNGSVVNDNGIDMRYALDLVNKNRDKYKGNTKSGSGLNEHKDWTSMTSLDVLKEVDADIALELTPGNVKTAEPGLTHITKALEAKKNVVTSNKAPLAIKFSYLTKLAKKNNVKLKYEASVGGAIPIINLYRETLQVNEIESIYGILNGTSNFVLDKMATDGIAQDVALKEAQELGIAETDPSYDIQGIDTGAKVAILANALMNKDVSFKDVRITGIEDITAEAIDTAKKHGYVIKSIGDVGKLTVSPRLIPLNHPLNVSGSLNAIMLHTDISKDITIIGRGAGAIETAGSIFSDILEVL